MENVLRAVESWKSEAHLPHIPLKREGELCASKSLDDTVTVLNCLDDNLKLKYLRNMLLIQRFKAVNQDLRRWLANVNGSFLPRCMECRRGLAIRILSVRLSVKRVICNKMEESSVQICISYERSSDLVFWEEEWLVGGRPLLPEILVQLASVGAKSPILNRYSLVCMYSASAVTPTEKSSINA